MGVSDGFVTTFVAPLTSMTAWCGNTGSNSNRLFFPNYRYPRLIVDTTQENNGLAKFIQGLEVGQGYTNGGGEWQADGDLNMDGALSVASTSTFAQTSLFSTGLHVGSGPKAQIDGERTSMGL